MKRVILRIVALAVFVAATVMVVPQPASALVLRMGLPELSQAADAVVVAKVTGSAVRDGSKRGARRPVPTTETRLQVTRVLAGERSQAVSIVQPGGVLDGVRLTVSDLPTFSPGETCVLFLSERDGVVGAFQGKLAVDKGRVSELGITVAELERRVRAYRSGVDPDSAFDAPVASVEGLAVVSGAEGAAEVTVPADEGAQGVTALSGPMVATISPVGQIAGIGRTVQIDGSGFGATRGTGKVQFVYGLWVNAGYSDAAAGLAPVVSWSDTRIVVQVPRYATAGSVKVTTGGGLVAYKTYEVGFSTAGDKMPGPVSYRVNENYPGVTGEGAEIVKAFDTWNAAGSFFRVNHAGATAATAQTTNGNSVNEIWFAPTAESPGSLALNYLWSYGGDYIESDIILNTAFSWASSATGSAFDIQSVVLHEVGHTVGLDDQYPDYGRVMGAASPDSTRRVLTAHERAGAVFLHGGETPDAPVVTSSSHPVQGTWYASATATFGFLAQGSVGGYSYVVDTSPSTTPDAVTETASSLATVAVGEGERWFHVRAVSSAGIPGPVSHFRVLSDTTPPQTSSSPGGTFEGTATVTLSASDARSGVASTWYQLDGGALTRYQAPVTVTGLGEHRVEFRSIDAAGNTEEFDAVSITIVEPTATGIAALTSSTHPTQSAWHSALQASFSFPANGAVAGYSYVHDGAPATDPDAVIDTADPSVTVPAVQGERWFHVRAVGPGGETGATRHFRVLTDVTAPSATSDARSTYLARATISLSASDAHSGVESIWYRLGSGPLTRYTAPVVVTAVGTHTLTFHGTDRAGNTGTPASASFRIDAPVLPASKLTSDPAARLTPSYGGRALIAVRLRGADGVGLANRSVRLESSTGHVLGQLLHVTGSAGLYVVTAPLVRSRTVFTVRFPGDSANAGSSVAVAVKPRAYLTRKVPTSARHRSRFSVTGTIKPAHTGAAVRVEVQKRNSSRVYRANSASKTIKTSSTAIKTSLRLARGMYRVRLVHSDAGHARKATSWAYVRVR